MKEIMHIADKTGENPTNNRGPAVRKGDLSPDYVAYIFIFLNSGIICHKLTLPDKPWSLCKLELVFPI